MRTARKFRRTLWLLNQGQEVYRRQEDGRGKPSIQRCWTLLKGWAVGLQSKFGPAAGHRPVHKSGLWPASSRDTHYGCPQTVPDSPKYPGRN